MDAGEDQPHGRRGVIADCTVGAVRGPEVVHIGIGIHRKREVIECGRTGVEDGGVGGERMKKGERGLVY